MGNLFWQKTASRPSTCRADKQEKKSTACSTSSKLMQRSLLRRVNLAAPCRRCLRTLGSCLSRRCSTGWCPYLLRTLQLSGRNTSFFVPGFVQVLIVIFSSFPISSITLGPTVLLVR